MMAKLFAIGIGTLMVVTLAAGVGHASPAATVPPPATAFVYVGPYVYEPYGYGPYCSGPYDGGACVEYPPYGFGFGVGFGEGIFFRDRDVDRDFRRGFDRGFDGGFDHGRFPGGRR